MFCYFECCLRTSGVLLRFRQAFFQVARLIPGEVEVVGTCAEKEGEGQVVFTPPNLKLGEVEGIESMS